MKHFNGLNHKLIVVLISLLITNNFHAQETLGDNHTKIIQKIDGDYPISLATSAEVLQTDNNIDVTFYHIAVDIDITSKTISGDTYIELVPVTDGLTQVKLNFHSGFTITNVMEEEVSLPNTSYTWVGDILTINLTKSYNTSETVKIRILYNGEPPLAEGSYIDKGFRFDQYTSSKGTTIPAIATFSTPYLSHYWFPCKDGTTDKANSVWVDITLPDVSYDGKQLIGVSNGLMTGETTDGAKRTFKWQHNHPIVPYYIMVAASNYEKLQVIYNKNGHNFPIEHYVFPNHSVAASDGVSFLPEVFDTFISYFGDYPFKDEKFGFTQIAVEAGIENQTNPIMFSLDQIWRVNMIHELSHMWFGTSITNITWQHVWLNEGFATYAEALYHEDNGSIESYHSHLNSMSVRFNKNEPIYLADDSDYKSIFNEIAYKKGAWVLHMLRKYIGDELFFSCIKSYAQGDQFLYKHASTEDFRDHCESISGVDLDTFFDQWIYDKGYPVYTNSYSSNPSENTITLNIVQKQKELYSLREVFEMYLDVKFYFSDGTTQIERVLNNTKEQEYTFTSNKIITNVEIDPEQWVIRESLSNQKKIVSFEIPGQVSAIIDELASTIIVTLPEGTETSALLPIITVSDKATISPASETPVDLSDNVEVYTVTAEDHTTKNYTLSLNFIYTGNDISTFTIDGQIGETVIDNEASTILVKMPAGTELNNLTPTITASPNATVSPASAVAQDFSSGPVEYTVTAENLLERTYLVTVTHASNIKQITAFTIEGQVVATSIDQINHTIAVTMPYGTDLSNLAPTITVSDQATVSPASGQPVNFSTGAITFTVTAGDETNQIYTVDVTNEILNGLKEVNDNKIVISPNPTINLVEIISNKPIKKVEISTLNGVVIGSFNYTGIHTTKINLEEFGTGIFILKVTSSDNSSVFTKVMVNK